MTALKPAKRGARPAAPAQARGLPASAPCARGAELWAYLDGELPAARARAVARHTPTCRSCTSRARQLRAMLEACRSAGCQELPAGVRARAVARAKALVRAGSR